MSDDTASTIRVDKWLWYARFLKSRSLASRFVSDGNLRIEGERSTKPSRTVKPGDVLTFPQGSHIRVIRIIDIGKRRGPAPEAQTLYEDLSPPEHKPRVEEVRTGPRPTKRNRREMERYRDEGL